MTYLLEIGHSPNFYTPGQVLLHYGRPRAIKGITIHWWGLPSSNPTFEGTVNYLSRPGGNTSANEIIEAGRVALIVDHVNAAWHAGSAQGNAETLGLELNPRGSDEDYATAGERIHDLRGQYGDVPLYPHRYWRNTQCPGDYNLIRLDTIARGGGWGQAVPVSNPVVAPPAAPAPTPAAPQFPLPGGYYFGWKSGPTESVSGYFSYRDDLRRWQQRMADRGWNISADGLYGPQTNNVTVAFQAEKGLDVDGKIGPQTWAAAWTAPIT